MKYDFRRNSRWRSGGGLFCYTTRWVLLLVQFFIDENRDLIVKIRRIVDRRLMFANVHSLYLK